MYPPCLAVRLVGLFGSQSSASAMPRHALGIPGKAQIHPMIEKLDTLSIEGLETYSIRIWKS